MNFELKALSLFNASAEKSDLLLLLVPEGFAASEDPLSLLVQQALQHGDFETTVGKQLQMYQLPAVSPRKLVLLGAGKGSAREVRAALLGAAGSLKAAGVKRATVLMTALPEVQHSLAAAVQAVAEAGYEYTATKSEAKPAALRQVVFGVAKPAAVRAAFDLGVALSEGQALAKEWGNRPANHATPTLLAGAAKALAKQPRISCKVHGPKDVAKLGMGSFMAVARGSDEPLQFIELHYNGAAKSEAPVVLVGKGITFDSGGISLKPAAAMDEMKFDMCGAASVLGVFRTLAQLQPAINVVGLIPACENLPSSRSVKPGDVVTSMSGQTIEVLNTDAEGRLVLCDALTYAARFKPRAMVDIATLTGACVIALGGVRSGLFSPSDALATALQQAGDQALDACWRLPLDDDYADGLKSRFADVANVAGRAGGAVTAAKFLQRFVGDIPWAHLDIAGSAWKEGAAKGATGRPVGLLVHYLLNQGVAAVAPKAAKATAAKPVSKTTPKRAAKA